MSRLLDLASFGPTLPLTLMVASTAVFLVLERLFPGRELPHAKGWYARAILITVIQIAITYGLAQVWSRVFADFSLFDLAGWKLPFLEGFTAWFAGTFFFYGWHRLRHAQGWWLVFHQLHHAPSRIEVATSFYKHPIEILVDAALSALILYPLLGASLEGAYWYTFFAGTGEYFYHANLRTPAWLRYFIQTPELHSIHHEYDVHHYNYGDIPLWDRLFGTYRDTTEFAPRCGFPEGAEERLIDILAFRDVYVEDQRPSNTISVSGLR